MMIEIVVAASSLIAAGATVCMLVLNLVDRRRDDGDTNEDTGENPTEPGDNDDAAVANNGIAA